ncbi:serine-threonine protein kinase [Streptomyces sp. BI20]|uniref:serine-threonine protein kinase n=1 Tax=Streptomyces sp. BI20 TaxID=3403460 RepID=UPI003C717B88
MAGVGVRPYAELTFDADGDVDPASRAAVARLDATDLVVFAHGWNSDRSSATRLYDRFLAPFPALLGPGVRVGYVGVVWPSMRFSDEPIPDLDPVRPSLALPGHGAGLDPATVAALRAFWPGREAEVDRLAALLEERPAGPEAAAGFGVAVARLCGVGTGSGGPALFTGDPLRACRELAVALAEAGGSVEVPVGWAEAAGAGPRAGARTAFLADERRALWQGARELLRQATYFEMKRRAGTVGERGLGPLLAGLAAARPALRVHLIGHSFGARLSAFALRAVPPGARWVRSLTLLQGAFSHHAFSTALPHDPGVGGALAGLQGRVAGPVVACHSAHDTALGVFYPLASRTSGDERGLLGLGERWGAIGYDGVRAVAGAPRLTLDRALASGLPRGGCVSVDAAAVVRRGGAPSGAHGDICHPELARLVVSAGELGP